MNEKKTSVFSNGLIWFGAGVSLAEILTGTYFAPLGFGKAMAAILLAASLGEDSGTIEDVYEPYLVKNDFINRTPKGRVATAFAYEHFGRTPKSE